MSAAAADFLDAARAGDVARLRDSLAADPQLLTHRNELGQSALMLALYHRKAAAAEFLRQSGNGWNFHEACALGDTSLLDIMLRQHPQSAARINDFSGDGFTPLALACFFGREEAARWLVDRGADVNLAANNPMQVAPIHAAAAGRHLGILQLLLEHGANVNARQQQGFTALHAAAQHGDLRALELLLAKGADRQARAANQQTPLDLAMQNGHAEAAALLET